MTTVENKRSKLLPVGPIAVGVLAPMPVEMIARSIPEANRGGRPQAMHTLDV